jgi:Ca-activated chloride channel homolog
MRTHKWITIFLSIVCIAGGLAWGIDGQREAKITVSAEMDKPVVQTGAKQIAHIRIGLTGFKIEEPQERAPVNMSIVIDKSGSMNGEKIQRALEAAEMVVERLGREDILSVVAYDSTVKVILPATRVSDRETLIGKIRQIRAGGNTALFAGLSKGAAELRKFLADERVNRVILLSDGLANVGPSSPSDLGALGASLIKEGISVTTIGIGAQYNEDLMTQISIKSYGDHYFAENASQLAGIFDKELNRALRVVAQEVDIRIECAPGVRPVKVLGRESEINGNTVHLFTNQVFADQTRSIILQVELPEGIDKEKRDVADINVIYQNMKTKSHDKLDRQVAVAYAASEKTVMKSQNRVVLKDVIEVQAAENYQKAIKLQDEGKKEEAQKILFKNGEFIQQQMSDNQIDSKDLQQYAIENIEAAEQVETETKEEYNIRRKSSQMDFFKRARK